MTRHDDFIGQLESYLDEFEGDTPLPDATRDDIRAALPSIHQRPAWWPGWRLPEMNNIAKLGVAAAVAIVAALVGYNYLIAPNVGGPGVDDPAPTIQQTPSSSPAPLAVGNFTSHGGDIELDATGDGSNVTGTMTYTDVGGADLGGFVVDLACTRTTDGGLILIGGPVIDATNGYVESAPEGSNIAIVLQRGSPVRAEFYVEHPDPHEPSCPVFLESIPDLGDPERPPSALEPIEGTIELRP